MLTLHAVCVTFEEIAHRQAVTLVVVQTAFVALGRGMTFIYIFRQGLLLSLTLSYDVKKQCELSASY